METQSPVLPESGLSSCITIPLIDWLPLPGFQKDVKYN